MKLRGPMLFAAVCLWWGCGYDYAKLEGDAGTMEVTMDGPAQKNDGSGDAARSVDSAGPGGTGGMPIASGGTTGSGGDIATGGTTGPSGGATGSGGAPPGTGGGGTGGGAGGVTPTGGRPGTGGVPGLGGRPGSGGMTGSGGVTGSGGRSGSGGLASSGGTTGTGGAAGAGGQPAPPDPDLVLWYRFDEAQGTTAANSALPIGGLARNATLATSGSGGGIAFSTAHEVGSHSVAFTANGASGGGYVTVPAIAALAPQAVTITTWVFVTSSAKWQRIFDLGTNSQSYLFLTPREGSDANNFIRFSITTGGASAEQKIDIPMVLPLNSWHHLAVVLPAGQTYAGLLYLDGTPLATNPAMTLHPTNLGTMATSYLGRSRSADPFLAGQLDDLRVYRRALTTAEIRAIMLVR